MDSTNNLVVNNGTDDNRNITVEMVGTTRTDSEPETINFSLFRVDPCSSTVPVEHLKIIQMRINLRSGKISQN